MGGNHMAAKVAIIIALAVAVTPAIGAIAWQGRTAGAVNRSVELSGPILGFTQSRERIQVRLVPAGEKEQRNEVVVRSAAGNLAQSIPLKHGQTWASAKLNAGLASAGELKISVE